MNVWTNIFTVETWQAAAEREYAVTGFPPPTPTKGGYFDSTFAAVTVGDLLACYVKAPAKRWVGVLRVESPMYLDQEDPLWGRSSDGSTLYPARFRTTPIVALDVSLGVPVEETMGVLECMKPRTWSGVFRRSLTRIPAKDGEKLLELLRQPRDAAPVRVPRKRPRRVPRVQPADEHVEPTEERPPTLHRELIWKLITLGKALSCEVWVASDERGKSFEGQAFSDHVLPKFPSVGLDPESQDLVRSIDVLWIRGKAIHAAFEVEATTSIYSGLLRMSDLVALQPNTAIALFIVAPDERRAKVHAEITRPTFESFEPPLRERCMYLPASGLEACVERTKPPLNRYVQPSVIREFAEAAIFAG